MKYKIGNVEVEAIQWKGDNFDEIAGLLFKIEEHNITTKYNGSMHLYISDDYIYRSQYIVVLKESHFVLSEQDFNNMATKVEEPKFKVGDKVYWRSTDTIRALPNICFDLFKIGFVNEEGGSIFSYNNDKYSHVRESELFTLEEAIEKLKEL